tara:strand:- start:82 stop:744 length:663 start_codon:yes stop_codon:yes gene_type:complete
MYDRGHGKDRNWKKALNWYNKSADQGYNKAICELGTFYLFGVAGVEKNKSKAVKLFKKAAEKGNDDAELYLQVLDDIEEYKSNPDVVATSKMSKSVMKVDYSDYEGPLVLSSNSWLKKVHYENNTSSTMTIFPTTGVLAERNSLNIKRYPDDEIQYEDYSPCPEIKPSTETYNIAQTHDVFIRNSKPVRTIGYMYIIATFSKFDVPFYIKLPYAFCWPQK